MSVSRRIVNTIMWYAAILMALAFFIGQSGLNRKTVGSLRAISFHRFYVLWNQKYRTLVLFERPHRTLAGAERALEQYKRPGVVIKPILVYDVPD